MNAEYDTEKANKCDEIIEYNPPRGARSLETLASWSRLERPTEDLERISFFSQELSRRLGSRDRSSSYKVTYIGEDSATMLVILVPPTVPIDNPQAPSQACPCTRHEGASRREL